MTFRFNLESFGSRSKIKVIFSLGMLYASKSGAIVVGLFVLPLYGRLLGPEAFGIVALILSLQAFLLLLDLGMSTVVGRDIAASQNNQENFNKWRAAELLLLIVHSILLLIAVVLYVLLSPPFSIFQVVFCIIFFGALTINNLEHSVLLSKRQFIFSGATQVFGVLARALVTVGALLYIRADLNTFLVTQTLAAIVQVIITNWLCKRVLNPQNKTLDFFKAKSHILKLAKRGAPLVLFGISGAAAMQLDKVIIPLYLSPATLGPYFLASSLCLAPLAILAGPVNQYFFPKIVESISQNQGDKIFEHLRKLMLCICIAVAVPSIILWFGREEIIGIWLHHQPNVADVIGYFEIILPGVALGTFGYVPYNILVAHQDYRVHAVLSAVLTTITLLAVTISAYFGSIIGVCWVYVGYHTISAIVIWLRACQLEQCNNQKYATHSALYALKLLFCVSIIVLGFFFLTQLPH